MFQQHGSRQGSKESASKSQLLSEPTKSGAGEEADRRGNREANLSGAWKASSLPHPQLGARMPPTSKSQCTVRGSSLRLPFVKKQSKTRQKYFSWSLCQSLRILSFLTTLMTVLMYYFHSLKITFWGWVSAAYRGAVACLIIQDSTTRSQLTHSLLFSKWWHILKESLDFLNTGWTPTTGFETRQEVRVMGYRAGT